MGAEQEQIERLRNRIADLEAERDVALEEKTKRMANCERIVEKAERDTGYALPEPWRNVAIRFVGQHGLSSPGLYLLFDTLMALDREAKKER